MTDPGTVVVEQGGVVVEKSFEPDAFPVPAIAFAIRSDRDEPTVVRLVDRIPDDVATEDVGFHPKYGADFWAVADEHIVFEREFDPGEAYTTVYGLRASDTERIERFLTEPELAAERQASREPTGDGEPTEVDSPDGEADTTAPAAPGVRVERGDIVVDKRYEPDDFPVPAIVFEIRSDRQEPAEIRLVDSIPDDVAIEDVGFHPEYGADHWTVEGHRIVFARALDPGETYTTVYGLRKKDPEYAERFLTEPTIEAAEAEARGAGGHSGPEPGVPTQSGETSRSNGQDGTGSQSNGRGERRRGPDPVVGSGEYTDSIDATYEAFERVEPLGGGGFADVYLAEYAGREVALKVPRFGDGATLSRDVVDRFTAEADNWTGVDDHPNVVTVLDHGTHGGLPWLALEYVPGGDLAAVTGSLPLDEAAAVGIGVARAVHYAHRHGVSHLDLKPENVLLDGGDRPTPKVTDWGLSRTLLDETGTMDGLSVAYAAPEQFDGRSPDDFTDIYQLGALLFELFTGEPPYDGPPMAILQQKEGEPPSPTAMDPSLPPTVDEVVRRAMAAAKTDRYETVVDLRRDLAALRDDDA